MAMARPVIYGNVTIGGPGMASTIPNSVYVSNGTGATWAPTTASNNAKMTAKGELHLEGDKADIIVNGKSLNDWMQAVEKRLAILQPRPELQDKYSALEEAWNHYKTLEALLYDDQKSNK